ncbi:hypothetical protein AVEN_75562-1 [Araneus ventricosus]|uniref:Uncharacterized protein n=1 Tax=Araneus ventricosus TaxID=182803 RepID=A0A4Y2RTK7_ARAVE|nr:hypothetical protein AVEN_75562-1 [Araneus ventricosus]
MLTIPAALMWSRRKIKEAFNVSDYSVRKAQKLFKDQGFLAEPARRNGKQSSPDIIELVKKFYQLDEQSRILPGMKDVAKFEDYDDEDIVEYNQWVSTDRTEMIRCSTSVGELIEKLVEKLNKLIPHSYIAKSQSSFFKNLKGTASSNTAVVSMDFSENYAFTIQDEAQGYHWNSNSCTIHPVMIHCKDTSNVKLIIPLCIISDDLKRDVSMVYEIQKNVTGFLKENYPHITNIHYFSDGCAGQYKNKYNFMNLCLHEKDFKLKAQWSFFATSHGKTECDGIGGTVKRLARKQSLQQHLDRQITTTNELFEFCKVNIANITFQHISKEAVDSTSLTLESRLKDT